MVYFMMVNGQKMVKLLQSLMWVKHGKTMSYKPLMKMGMD